MSFQLVHSLIFYGNLLLQVMHSSKPTRAEHNTCILTLMRPHLQPPFPYFYFNQKASIAYKSFNPFKNFKTKTLVLALPPKHNLSPHAFFQPWRPLHYKFVLLQINNFKNLTRFTIVQRHFLSHLLSVLLQTTKIKVQKFKTFTYIFTWSSTILTSSLFYSQKTTPHKSPSFSSFIGFLFLVFKFSYWL